MQNNIFHLDIFEANAMKGEKIPKKKPCWYLSVRILVPDLRNISCLKLNNQNIIL
jgi:hypothetical protein